VKVWNENGLWEGDAPSARFHYSAFADVSWGIGASNSALKIGANELRAEVAEFVTSDMPPEEFARYAVAMCRWFGVKSGCVLGYERNGPGENFAREVQRLGFNDVMHDVRVRGPFDAGKPGWGWWSDKNSKIALLSDLRGALAHGEYHTRDAAMLSEAYDYVYYPSRAVGPSHMEEDKEGARKTHGDRVIASAGLNLMFKSGQTAEWPESRPAPTSFLAMDAARQLREARAEETTW
jgi:hypothetical protein